MTGEFNKREVMYKKIKLAVVISSVALMSACGGGGGGSAPVVTAPTVRAVVLTTLSNGQGVGRVTVSNGKASMLMFSPDIVGVINGANKSAQNGSSDAFDVISADYPVISSTAATTTRRGTITSNGLTINVTFLENNRTNDAIGMYFEVPNDADLLSVVGTQLTSTPTSGVYLYTGVLTNNARSSVAPDQIGSVNINVDFSLKTFTILGSTSTMSISGGGVVDTVSGLFASSNISVSKNGVSYKATLYGNLNGAEARAVSGVFYTNDSVPDLAGSFISSR